MIELLLLLTVSYLLGSVPTSIIIGKIVGKIDIREHGSGNAGMTNIFRILGWKPALVVGSIDFVKGWFATSCVLLLPSGTIPLFDVDLIQIMAGCAAILGHTYTIFSGLRGGKGVMTLMGMLIALYPAVIPFCLITFITILILWGFVSLASICATAVLPLIVFLSPSLGFQDPNPSLKYFSLIILFFILFTHRSNLKRLKNGTENRFERAMIIKRKRKKRK